MRSKGPPPPANSQPQVPQGSGEVPGPDHSAPNDPGLPGSADRPALPPALPLRSGNDHQMMEAMEMIQEEIQTMMATKPQ